LPLTIVGQTWLRRSAALIFFALGACTRPASVPSTESTQVAEGRRVFIENCSSCHNIDPTLDGSVGPAIAGSPRVLVQDRVLYAAYPPGYHPKRPSHLMRPLPWLGPEIGDLTAYLQAARQAQKPPGG
jgi:mono/diheme cytochrome c family protein